jgi:NAD(P)-dependent dehydrogenase (short-subunit alcohol dehydrogenase family)
MNHRVLITTGASGIGREIARTFAATGAKVFVCDIDESRLKPFATQPPGLITNVCEVSQRTDVERMVAFAKSNLKGLEVLSSVLQPRNSISDNPRSLWCTRDPLGSCKSTVFRRRHRPELSSRKRSQFLTIDMARVPS